MNIFLNNKFVNKKLHIYSYLFFFIFLQIKFLKLKKIYYKYKLHFFNLKFIFYNFKINKSNPTVNIQRYNSHF